MKKVLFGGVLSTAVFIFLFMFLLKGCLSQYDERCAVPPLLYFEKNGQQMVFSVVRYEETDSYSSGGGITQKSVTNHYYLQTNKIPESGKNSSKEVFGPKGNKRARVEVLGGTARQAWVFAGELRAYDPFTLNLIADAQILEQKFPQLKGKLPSEKQFYQFDPASRNIRFTATDGSVWQLKTEDLSLELMEDGELPTALEQQMQVVRDRQEQVGKEQTSAMQVYMQLVRNNKSLKRGELDKGAKFYYDQRKLIDWQQDSLRTALAALQVQLQHQRDVRNKLQTIQRYSPDYTGLFINQDTAGGEWFGLYAPQELKDLTETIQLQSAYSRNARRQLYNSGYHAESPYNTVWEKNTAVTLSGNHIFLDGGFLLDAQSGQIIRLKNPDGYLLVYKDKIGTEGTVIVCRIDRKGMVSWQKETHLKNWNQWLVTPTQLVVLGMDNEELSSGDANVLLSIDLASGNSSVYDFFKDQIRK
ncbi:MAG TPA: PA2928 family protein [Flavisolibacter sp.]|nr:PA2928 family protein [Flavisolibacter sp.]